MLPTRRPLGCLRSDPDVAERWWEDEDDEADGLELEGDVAAEGRDKVRCRSRSSISRAWRSATDSVLAPESADARNDCRRVCGVDLPSVGS